MSSKAPPYALAHALAYAAHGWPVLALTPGGKHPAMPGHGFRDATTDAATVQAWFASVPGAGVGIHPGPAGLLVLDIDVKGGAPGLESLESLQGAHGTLPATLRQRTPSGGFHLFFGLDAAGDFGNRKLAAGIDVRCAAGYVAAEPTRLDGKPYAFEDWDILTGEAPEIAQAPGWLLALLAAPKTDPAPAAGADDPATGPREFVNAQQVTELRSALNMLNADDYGTWIDNGHRLKGLGEVGRGLWLSWSQQSSKWQPADAQKWGTFKPDSTGYAAVFKAAQAAGWVNPASKAAALPGGPPGAPAGDSLTPPRPAFELVPVDDLDTAEIAPQAWAWEGYIPAREVTLLGAHGGAGKSTVSLMLAVCAAVGLPLFGVPTRAAPVVVFSGEDDAQTVRRRLRAVCRLLQVPPHALAGQLLVLDASDADPTLWGEPRMEEGPDGILRAASPATTAYKELGDLLADAPEPLLIVDNASDTFGGNEIKRTEVRGFVRGLRALVRKQGGAVLLLAHIDKSAAKGFGGGESYSGSTAWHNSARSRLVLKRDKDDTLILEHEKSNFGRKREPLRLVWPDGGLPQVDAPASGVVLSIATDNNTRAVLRLVHEFTQRGELVSTATTSRTHAGKLLRGQSTFPPRLPDSEVFDLLRRAERRGWIAKEVHRGANRHEREVWKVTSAGADAAGFTLPAPTASTAPTSEVDAPGAEERGDCVDCADFGAGGVGGIARAEVGAAEQDCGAAA